MLVASRAPLFWLYGKPGSLSHPCIATYPDASPPARLLRLVLVGDAQLIAARDDPARLQLVASGAADCALLSTATPPTRAAPLEPLFCLCERLPVPTTGIAAAFSDDPQIEQLLAAHRAALARIATDAALAQAVVGEAFGFDAREAKWVAEACQRHFTIDARVSTAYAEHAVRAVGGLGVRPYAPSALR